MYSHQLVTDQLNLELDGEKSKTSSNNMYLEEQQMSTTSGPDFYPIIVLLRNHRIRKNI